MIDLFGRSIDVPEERVVGRVALEDGWLCHGCAEEYDASLPATISVVEPSFVLFFCCDVCALSVGFFAVVQSRRAIEEAGYGWSIVARADGRPFRDGNDSAISLGESVAR